MKKIDLKKYRFGGSAAVLALGASSMSAHAELPAEAQAAFDNIDVGIDDMEAAAWPVIGAVVLALVLIKLFKRFTSKV